MLPQEKTQSVNLGKCLFILLPWLKKGEGGEGGDKNEN